MSIVEALRCCAGEYPGIEKCKVCKWSNIEWSDEYDECKELSLPADCEIDGREAWVSCDTDRICNEAADLIEKLCQEIGKAEKYKCAICGESYAESELRELDDMGEVYQLNGNSFICPDCWDELQRVDLSEQMKRLMRGEGE